MISAKEVGIEIAETINGLDLSYKKELLKALIDNIDKSTRLELENAMEVVI